MQKKLLEREAIKNDTILEFREQFIKDYYGKDNK